MSLSPLTGSRIPVAIPVGRVLEVPVEVVPECCGSAAGFFADVVLSSVNNFLFPPVACPDELGASLGSELLVVLVFLAGGPGCSETVVCLVGVPKK